MVKSRDVRLVLQILVFFELLLLELLLFEGLKSGRLGNQVVFMGPLKVFKLLFQDLFTYLL